MADIGCGIGGSSRHVARAFPGATAHGITLSPVQAARATALAADAGLAAVARFSVGDALRPCPPLEEGGYDLVWSLESGEHMPDKRAFVRALASLAAPGGKVVIATWVHRDLEGERRGEGGGKERTEGSKRGVQRKAQNALSFSLSLQPAKPPSPPPTPPCWPPSTPPTTCRPGAAGRTTWS
jgi:cyclopropane fatty-acyl-phospholipid synthase-like methyltransferase